MKKIIFVSHCILNTASKVVLYNQEEIDAEENLRIKFLNKAISNGIQIIQLPCPEFTLYGAKRWGHVSNQFDNTFFRKHCRKILEPIIDQLKEYLENEDFFEVLALLELMVPLLVVLIIHVLEIGMALLKEELIYKML